MDRIGPFGLTLNEKQIPQMIVLLSNNCKGNRYDFLTKNSLASALAGHMQY